MNLVWFRNDLRVDDNPALYEACADPSNGPVKAIFISTSAQWQLHDESPIKIAFLEAALINLQVKLAALGIELELLHVNRFSDVAMSFQDYCDKHEVDRLYLNEQIPLNERRLDEDVERSLASISVEVIKKNDDRILPLELKTRQGGLFRVFTPWFRQWQSQFARQLPELCPQVPAVSAPVKITNKITLSYASEYRQDLWPADEDHAMGRLHQFCQQRSASYSERRDFPAVAATSTLSPYLAVGLISPRRCAHALLAELVERGQGVEESLEHSWIRELAWRDFYRYLMLHHPLLSMNMDFQEKTRSIAWKNNPEHERAWQEGRTGFPIIDAAMIQLKQSGWMHNRLRMLVASFFCKLLLLDWRKGESFFMRHLVDGDFASNNGGWQWSASTGCDASPWFRIFNPITQSKKFDPQGQFIRRFLPCLNELSDKDIHWPSDEQRRQCDYPMPIIDYASARKSALEFFKQ